MRDLKKNPFYGTLKEFDHWVVLFREKQVTIGSVIIMSKHLDQTSLGALSADAWAEFGAVTQFTESLITHTFGAEKFNYLALMMYDPEVHFHVIPRYSKPVEFEGHAFIDLDWPEATKRVGLTLESDVLRAIEAKMLAAAKQFDRDAL